MDVLLDVYLLSIVLLLALIVIWGLTAETKKPRKPMPDDEFEDIIKHGLKSGSVKRINGRT